MKCQRLIGSTITMLHPGNLSLNTPDKFPVCICYLRWASNLVPHITAYARFCKQSNKIIKQAVKPGATSLIIGSENSGMHVQNC